MEIEIRKKYFASDSKTIFSERSYVNGIQNGLEYRYWSDGKLAWKTNYINGLRSGTCQSFGLCSYIRDFISQYKKEEYNGPLIIFKYEN